MVSIPARLAEVSYGGRRLKVGVDKKKYEPSHGRYQGRGTLSSDSKQASPNQHVRDFTNESFTVSHGHHFYSACRKQLSLKQSIIQNNIQSSSIKRANNDSRSKKQESGTLLRA